MVKQVFSCQNSLTYLYSILAVMFAAIMLLIYIFKIIWMEFLP